MDITFLEATVQKFYTCGIAKSTDRTYTSAKKRFLKFCLTYNITLFSASETTLCLFVSYLAKEGLHYQSIRAYLSALRHLYISQGQPDPFTQNKFPRLQYVLKGVHRCEGPAETRVRLPITPTILAYLREAWSQQGDSSGQHAVLVFFFCLPKGRGIHRLNGTRHFIYTETRRHYSG